MAAGHLRFWQGEVRHHRIDRLCEAIGAAEAHPLASAIGVPPRAVEAWVLAEPEPG
ncbi:MAG: hypothetical protein ACFBRM_13445 [Pikeienuella sp.]